MVLQSIKLYCINIFEITFYGIILYCICNLLDYVILHSVGWYYAILRVLRCIAPCFIESDGKAKYIVWYFAVLHGNNGIALGCMVLHAILYGILW